MFGTDFLTVPNWHGMHYNPDYFPEPTKYRPERFTGEGVPRGHFRSFSRGPRACAGENLAMEMLKTQLLLTAREFDFSLTDKNPNAVPRTKHTDLDTILGDLAFSELKFEARPRGGVMVKVRRSGWKASSTKAS
jgi:hypothetical protein